MEAKDIIAMCSVVVALGALAVSISAGIQNRRHNRLSVRPRLRIDYFTYLKAAVRVALVNNGTGPAIIRSVSITVDGTAVNADDVPVIVAAAKRLDIPGPYDSYTLSPGDTLRATESVDLLTLGGFPEDVGQRKELRRKLHRIDFRVTYESIYGETFALPVPGAV
jgi:hypothetical protein